MRTLLYHDYVIGCATCNLRCDYCLSVKEGAAIGGHCAGAKKGRAIDVCDAVKTLKKLYKPLPAPILKISGGELFFQTNVLDLLEELSKMYAHVQVLTNGVLLNAEMIGRLASMGNIGLNISMDGHTPQMNRHRFSAPKQNDFLLEALRCAVASLGSVEITSVMTDANAKDYEAFLEFLESLPGAVTAFPIPVRGKGVQALFSLAERKRFAGDLVEIARRHPSVTGPAVYYECLAGFLTEEPIRRKYRCFIPNLSVQLFDSGTVVPCPLGWTEGIGHVDEPEQRDLLHNFEHARIYELLTHPRHRPSICHDCYAQTDLLNLYLQGRLSIGELRRVPMYQSERVVETLGRIYAQGQR